MIGARCFGREYYYYYYYYINYLVQLMETYVCVLTWVPSSLSNYSGFAALAVLPEQMSSLEQKYFTCHVSH